MKKRIIVATVILMSSCVTDRVTTRSLEKIYQSKILEAPSFDEACRRYERTPRELRRAMLLQLMMVAYAKGDSTSLSKVFHIQVTESHNQF